jgi:hypothetical protein
MRNSTHKLATAGIIAGLATACLLQTARADEPGRGLTARYEVGYLKFIADHHLSALRMTELAVGTDLTRDPAISPDEGTSPTQNTQPVQARPSPTLSSLWHAAITACSERRS